MSRRLLVVGAGGHGRVVADAALSMGMWDEMAFIDDRVATTERVLELPVLGSTHSLPGLRDKYHAVVVAIGAASDRLRLLEHCRSLGFDLPVVVHPAASVSRFSSLREGCVVCAQAVVNAGAVLEKGCIVNTASSVDHDCRLGIGVHVCPGARLAADVHVGDISWIGIGSCVKQGVIIGSNAIVAAGAVVIADVASGVTVMGNPAREKTGR
jgi:sugar O-acyltransferase (sialic acid O-acetyltransferase NeuD family)